MGLGAWLRRQRGSPEAKFLAKVSDAQDAHLAATNGYFEVGRGKQEEQWAALGLKVPKDWSVWVRAYGGGGKPAGYVVTQEETRQYGYRWRRCWSAGEVEGEWSARWARV